MDTGRSVARITLERALDSELTDLRPGVVIDVGAKHAPYRDRVPATEYLTLDIRPESGADIVGDLHDVPRESGSVDTVIATEVLEHCYDPARVVSEIHRLLRPGGVCLLSTRFIHPYHPDPHDYFRFTNEGLAHLFRPFSQVTVRPLGNRLHAVWMLLPRRPRPVGWLVAATTPMVAAVDLPGSANPCGFMVRAVAWARWRARGLRVSSGHRRQQGRTAHNPSGVPAEVNGAASSTCAPASTSAGALFSFQEAACRTR